MIEITGKTSDIIEALALFGASPDASTYGFNPLLFKVSKGKISTSAPNISHTAFVSGEFNIKTKGTGEMVIDVLHTINRLKKYFSNEEVTIQFDEDKGKTIIKNKKMKSYSHPPAKGDCEYREIPFKKDKKGKLLMCGDPDSPESPTTKIEIDAKELHLLLSQASDVNVDYYSLFFKKDEQSFSWIGDETDKTQNPIHTKIECTVRGKDASVQYSDAFKEIISVLKGKITLYTSSSSPLWVVYEWKNGKVEYIIAPRLDN